MENKKRNKIVPDRVVDKNIITRTIIIANYMLENKATFREASEYFKVGLHTIHTDIHTLLPQIDKDLYDKLKIQFNNKISERNSKVSEDVSQFFYEKAKERITDRKVDERYIKLEKCKKVVYMDGNKEIEYYSISEASRRTGYSPLTIKKHCENKVRKPRFKFV